MVTIETNAQTPGLLELNPDTFMDQLTGLDRTKTGLVDAVGFYGSTHTQAAWRNTIIEYLQKEDVAVFNPQLPPDIVWDYEKHAKPEAIALTTCSVIVFRLENRGLTDGSLGSIGEIGAAVMSAMLRGQRVIISIEKGFGKSLQDPAAVKQFAALSTWLEEVVPRAGAFVEFPTQKDARGNDLKNLSEKIKETMELQREQPLTTFDFPPLSEATHLLPIFTTVFGGSSGGYSDATNAAVSQWRSEVRASITDGRREDLAAGDNAQDWLDLDARFTRDGVTPETIFRAHELHLRETGLKVVAHLAAWSVVKEGLSTGAVTEALMIAAARAALGKQTVLYMEEFDGLGFLKTKIVEQKEQIFAELKEMSPSKSLSAEKITEMGRQVQEVLDGASSLNFKQLMKSLNAVNELKDDIAKADAANRVRTLALAHLARLEEYQNVLLEKGALPGRLFYVEHSREDFKFRVEQLTSPW